MQSIERYLLLLLILIQCVLALYMLIPFASLLIYLFVNIFRIKKPADKLPIIINRDFEFGIIITAHQETKFVIPLVDSILKQSFTNFFIYVVADDCDVHQLIYNDPRIKVLKPEKALNSKVKSIAFGVEHFVKKHDAVVIFDADNLIHPEFLRSVNSYFQKGYKVVQADFKPKNTDTTYARMDAIGDMVNFFLDREIRMQVGLSSAIWGSGIAVDYDLYTNVVYSDLLGGFDKKLQSDLVQKVRRIAFANDAILYDEKITNGKSLEKQRTRWISSSFKYFSESIKIFMKGVRKMNFNLAYFGFVLLRPPLFITVGLSCLFAIADLFFNHLLFTIWLAILSSFVLSFIGIILIKTRDLKYFTALIKMPFFVFRQVLALFKIQRARKSFLKTEHTKLLYIEDVINN